MAGFTIYLELEIYHLSSMSKSHAGDRDDDAVSNGGSDGDDDGSIHAEPDAGLSDGEGSDGGQDVVSRAGSTDGECLDGDDVSHAASADGERLDGDDGGAIVAHESGSDESDEYQTPDEAASDPESSVADSIVRKRTLTLGEEPTPSTPLDPPSEDEFQCSQVSNGWLGKAYNEESRQNKTRQIMEDNKKRMAKECTKK